MLFQPFNFCLQFQDREIREKIDASVLQSVAAGICSESHPCYRGILEKCLQLIGEFVISDPCRANLVRFYKFYIYVINSDIFLKKSLFSLIEIFLFAVPVG